MLPEDLYKTITSSIPIVCVDMIPVRENEGKLQLGSIIRATGQEAGKVAVIGGRINYQESIGQAMKRHLLSDLNIKDFSFCEGNDFNKPFFVQQYQHVASSDLAFDPSKHAIGLTYLIKIDAEPSPRNEAGKFSWLSKGEVPERCAYNQQILYSEAVKFLDKLHNLEAQPLM